MHSYLGAWYIIGSWHDTQIYFLSFCPVLKGQANGMEHIVLQTHFFS